MFRRHADSRTGMCLVLRGKERGPKLLLLRVLEPYDFHKGCRHRLVGGIMQCVLRKYVRTVVVMGTIVS